MSKTELGAWTEVQPVTLEVIKICLEVRPIILEKIVGSEFNIYIPVVYASQIVNGKEYVVKVLIDEDGLCFHAKILQACHGETLTVIGIHFPKTFDDPLIPF